MNQTDLRDNGYQTIGEVVEHSFTKRNNRTTYFASVRYQVRNRTYSARVQGPGAEPNRLPLGTKVPIRYIDKKPDFSSVTLMDASSGGGPGWYGVFGMWAITIAFLGSAWLIKCRVESAQKELNKSLSHK